MISAVIPVKNGEDFIADAIGSLLEQGDIVQEIVVVNNGSTDNTEGVVRSCSDARIKLVQSDIPNLPLSRNIGVDHASGTWLYFLDADDRVFPGSLKALLDAVPDEPDYAVVYGDYQRLTHEGEPYGARSMLPHARKPDGDVLSAFLTGNKMIVGSQIVRADWFRKVGGFNPEIRFAEDWEFWCRMAAHAKFRFVPGLTVLGYRMQPNSMSHHKVLSFEPFKTVMDEIYSQSEIVGSLDARNLRKKAETNCRAYICTEAVRTRAHMSAFEAYLKAVRHYPSDFFRTTGKYLGAYWGL